ATIGSTVAVSGYDDPAWIPPSGVDDTWGLETRITGYKIYSTDRTPTVTINYACEGEHGTLDSAARDFERRNPDGLSQTGWRFYRTNSQEIKSGGAIDSFRSSDLLCRNGQGDTTQAVTLDGSPASVVLGRTL